ncbi:DUF4440 domain-containing protein [Goodfellowiella coeruleoviolacea]|uniref:DUF4440 domain-containing protein n=1 Tax=Goodfellowiella coeruleoviolacea TaxID=334858 RepID=A0AAE3KGR9_9PSEU|nr:nuclear transport factor 2 family protein [Goodfellowiella coeruleoviolacea]MCP2166505.1 protein of unknown function (DUF4440) [Goodfellowiella coeruleoviolacea]
MTSTLAGPADRDALLDTDRRFFAALTAADHDQLDRILAEDFLIVAVDSGAVATRADLLALVRSGEVAFPEVRSFPEEAVVRRVGEVGVVVGRTAMEFTGPAGAAFHAGSRYTHVFTRSADDTASGWRLLSAQGTQIRTGDQPQP